MENNNDFEEMRQQIGLLKSKLDDQRIVNEDIIRHVVQQKMNTVNRVGWMVVIIGLLEIPLVLWVFRSLCGFSWLFCIITALNRPVNAAFFREPGTINVTLNANGEPKVGGTKANDAWQKFNEEQAAFSQKMEEMVKVKKMKKKN